MNATPFTNDDVATRATEVIKSLSSELSKSYKELQEEADRSIKLLDSLGKQQEEISLLEERVAHLRERIEKLENTKGLKLQRRYWKFRNKLRLGKSKNA